ncbi:MAG: dienelactone hydrolase family protein [Vicinamibacterales bacterium]
MNQEIIDLYDEYIHGGMTRRVFLERLAAFAGSSAVALALLPVLEGRSEQQAPLVPENAPNLLIRKAEYEAAGAKMTGYLARPKGTQKLPAVIVIHENRGLNAHHEDVTRRMATEGFLALGVDMLSPLGGTPADPNEAGKMLSSLNQDETVARLVGTVKFLAAHPESTGKVGAIGFCWGGGMVNSLAVAAGPALHAGVPYYGRQVPAADVPKISAPLLLHYAGTDERINAGIAEYEAALKANNKTYQIYMYEGAGHAFNNNTGPRYNKEAAELAWGRTIAFLKKHLAG